MHLIYFTVYFLVFGLVFSSCSNQQPALENTAELCSNRADDNGNGLFDCEDPSCIDAGFCGEITQELCSNGIDEDENGLTDCEELSCRERGFCGEATGAIAQKAGVQPSAVRSSVLEAQYQNWLERFFEVNPADPSMARVRRDQHLFTVSEGIGYGMLITLSMEETSEKMEQLWAYYKNFVNMNGVMNWCIEGFDKVADPCDHNGSRGYNGATDAELDVVAALIIGSKKYKKPELLQEARTLAQAIRTHEVHSIYSTIVNDTLYLLKLGDRYNALYTNPSYISPVALRLMRDNFPEMNWDKVFEDNFNHALNCVDPNTGLSPDWASYKCTSIADWANDPEMSHLSFGSWELEHGFNFGPEAVRVPWRMAWYNYWYGDKDNRAVAHLNRIDSWLEQSYKLDFTRYPTSEIPIDASRPASTVGSTSNAYFGGYCLSHTANPARQSIVDACWETMSTTEPRTYYNGSLNLIYTQLLAGTLRLYE
jgi:endo-1,4-beta-D-glucanase Y